MSYSGHVIDMINRFKQNRNLIRSRHEKIASLRERYLNAIPYDNKLFYEKKIPEEVLEKVKLEFRTQIIKERRRGIFLSISLTAVFLLIFLAAIFYIVRSNSQ